MTLFLVFSVAAVVNAEVVKFDDLPSSGGIIPNGYKGFAWVNFYYLDGINYPGNPSGYENGVVSRNNVAYNGYGQPAISAGDTFDFISAYFTAAWNDDLNIHVSCYKGQEFVDAKDFVVSTDGPTLVQFNWSNIDILNFYSWGGTHHEGYVGAGTHFAMDNFNFVPVPEPAAFAMLAGLGVMLAVGYRRRGRRS